MFYDHTAGLMHIEPDGTIRPDGTAPQDSGLAAIAEILSAAAAAAAGLSLASNRRRPNWWTIRRPDIAITPGDGHATARFRRARRVCLEVHASAVADLYSRSVLPHSEMPAVAGRI